MARSFVGQSLLILGIVLLAGCQAAETHWMLQRHTSPSAGAGDVVGQKVYGEQAWRIAYDRGQNGGETPPAPRYTRD